MMLSFGSSRVIVATGQGSEYTRVKVIIRIHRNDVQFEGC